VFAVRTGNSKLASDAGVRPATPPATADVAAEAWHAKAANACACCFA